MAISILIPETNPEDIENKDGFSEDKQTVKDTVLRGTTYDQLTIPEGDGTSSITFSSKKQNVFALTKDSKVKEDGGGYFTESGLWGAGLQAHYKPESKQPTFEQGQDGKRFLINVMHGDLLEFPCQSAGSFAPAELNPKITYSSNNSTMGQFLGRSVFRESLGVSLKPVTFQASETRINDVIKLLRTLREGPTYFIVDGPGGAKWIWYGWTKQEPSVSYTGVIDMMQISLQLEVA